MPHRHSEPGKRVPFTSKRLDLAYGVDIPVLVHLQDAVLAADLHLPDHALGMVVFAHGSGSSRFSPRNRAIADVLRQHSIGTLLLDLLMPDEEMVDESAARYRFDIPLLAERLSGAVEWVERQMGAHELPIGLFGASTGAAAAIITAAQQPDRVKAIVSRGGRIDLGGKSLPHLKTPTLIIVGSEDRQVLSLTQHAQRMIRSETQLEVIDGATHLFEEPGKLDEVARLSAKWFLKHLAGKEVRHSS
ncbi:MAG TPA: alpha/beta family hydrolase [Patescibacteria group bacterium]|nr:alpha/beta family hydrolase [Patescibacteria group bacterium]